MQAISECITSQNYLGMAQILGVPTEMLADTLMSDFVDILQVRLADFTKSIEIKAKAQGYEK